MSAARHPLTPLDLLMIVCFTVVPFVILAFFLVGNIPRVDATPTRTIFGLWIPIHVLAMGIGTLFIGMLLWISIKFRDREAAEEP